MRILGIKPSLPGLESGTLSLCYTPKSMRGFEPLIYRSADDCLTTWPHRLKKMRKPRIELGQSVWSTDMLAITSHAQK